MKWAAMAQNHEKNRRMDCWQTNRQSYCYPQKSGQYRSEIKFIL